MRDIKDSGADVIFSTVVGDGTTHLYQAYAEAGLDPWRLPIASLTTTEAELLCAMGASVGEAHITAASYFEGVQTDANRAFVGAYKKKFGDDRSTNACAETAYFQVYLFARALAQANSIASDDLRADRASAHPFDAPQGRVQINPTSGHANLWTRIGRANRAGQFDLVWESTAPVESDPFLICSASTGRGSRAPRASAADRPRESPSARRALKVGVVARRSVSSHGATDRISQGAGQAASLQKIGGLSQSGSQSPASTMSSRWISSARPGAPSTCSISLERRPMMRSALSAE